MRAWSDELFSYSRKPSLSNELNTVVKKPGTAV